MNNSDKGFVSVVAYVYNNSKEIETFLNCMTDVLKDNFANSEIIFVDDCSSDNSTEIIKIIYVNVWIDTSHFIYSLIS